MSKVIRLTSKDGLVKEVSFGAKVKLGGQFQGAKIEVVDIKTGLKVAKAKVRIDGDDVVVSFIDNGQEREARLEGAADGTVIADNSVNAPSDTAAAPSKNLDRDTQYSYESDFGNSALVGKIFLGMAAAGALGAFAITRGGKAKPDTTAPAAPTGLDLAAADDSGSNNADDVTNQTSALTITGQAEANARVELFDGTTSLGTTTANASGAFSLDVTLAAGARSITAKATDAAGNVGAASAALVVTVDGTPPAAPTGLDLAAADDSGSNNADDVTNQTSALTITGQAEANARVELFDGTTSLGTTTANASGAFSLDVTLAAGTRSITAKATDAAGNVGAASAALVVTVDGTPPAAPTGLDLAAADDSGSNNADDVTNQTSALTITGQADANARVELFDGTTSLGTTTANTTGAFSLDVTLAAGTRSITAKATDAAGNVGAASAALVVTVDGTPPAAPTGLDLAAADDSGSNNADDVTNQTSALTITGQADANARVELFDGTTSLGTTTANASGAFSLDVTLAAGTRSITAKATDAAGNVGAASAALSITVDSSAPLATLIAIDRASKTLTISFDQSLSIAGTLPNSAFSVTTAGGTPNAVTSIAVNGNTVLLTLADPIGSGATAVTYTDPSAANDAVALQDAAGNDTATFSLSLGVVADGYIRGAQIFVETVSNGQVTRTDTGVVTDAQGNFFIPAQYAGLTLVAVGGVNVDTGIVNTTNYRAPAGSTVINPLTTVIQAVIDASPNSTSVAAASQLVADALGLVLPSGSSLTNFDPIASGNVEVQRAAAQIAAIVAIADVNASSDEAQVFANIATQVTASSASNGSVDLASTQLVSAALAGTTTGANASLVADIQSAVTTIDAAVSIAAISQAQSDAIDNAAPGAPTQIDLIAADDTGTSNTDNITSKNSFAGTVSFNTTATDGTAVVAGDTVQVIVGGQVFASRMLTEADVVAGQASINFVSVSDGTYSGSTRIVDKAGNISPQSAAVTFTVDSTAPSAVIQISDALLAFGESAQVSIQFTEAVIGFSNVDVLADNGSLSTFSSSDGGVTWTATFTPDVDIEDASNLIRLASSYTDIAGNLGGAADSPNFVIDTLPNRTPTVSAAVPDQASNEDTAWSYQVPAGAFGDVDGDTLTYTAKLANGDALPNWLSFNAATRTFSGTPQQDFAGNVSLTVTASDGSASVSDTFVLTVSAVEDEATGSASISGTAAEGGSLTASVSATDVDGSITDTTYQWQVSPDGTTGWADLSGATTANYAIASDQSQVGKYLRVVATTTDALGGTSTLTSAATAAVANVNDAPTVSAAVPDQASNEDTAWSYQVPAGAFGDVDGDTLTYTAKLANGDALPNWLSFNAATRTFSGTPQQDFAGNVSLTVTASDGSASVSDTFVLTVSAVEDEATGSASISGTAAEGGSLTASVSATDVDGSITDTTYQWQVSPDGTTGWADLSGATTANYAIASDQSQVGKYLRVVATTTDALGGTSTLTSAATAAVANVNDAPTVSAAVPDQASNEDTAWSYQVPAGAFGDVDGDTLTYTAKLANGDALPNWLSFNAATRTFSGTPQQDFAGNVSLTVTASDGSASVSDTFVLTVSAVEDEATGSASISGTAAEGGSLTASVSATDVDGSITDTTYQWQVSPDGTTGWADLSGATTANYAIASDQSQVGKYLRVVATTTDALGGTSTLTSAETAAVANVNDAPTVSAAVPDQASNEDTAWSYQVPAGAFGDVDGDTLTYTAKLANGDALPNWLSFNAETRIFSGTPPQDFAGNVSLTVTASDGSASVSDTFVLTVSAVEDEATGSASISGTAAEGGSLTASVSATDVDGSITDTTYQWQVSPDGTTGWADLSGATTASYAIASDQSQVGKYLRVVATTTDALGGTSTLTSAETAAVANVNDAPTVSAAVPDQASNEDTAWSYQVPAGAFGDVDGDTLTYTAKLANGDALPNWLSFNAATRTFSGTPQQDFAGNVSLTVTASDGSASVSDTFVLTVSAVEDAPFVSAPIADQASAENAAWSYQFASGAFSDVDGDALTYSATLGDGAALPSWLSFNAGTRTFSGTPPQNYAGTLNLKVTASDGSLSASDMFTLSVEAVPVTVANGQTYQARAGTVDIFVIDVNQSITATIAGFESGDILQFTNHTEELGVNFEQVSNSDGITTITAGTSVAITLSSLANDNFGDEISFEAIYGANAIGYVIP